jgi:diguanylate cyclase (GGDEF)-like protein
MAISRFSIRHQLLLLGALVTASVWAGALLQYLQLRTQTAQLAEVRRNLASSARLDAIAGSAAQERGRSNGWLADRRADPQALQGARATLDRDILALAGVARESSTDPIDRLPQAVGRHVSTLAALRERIDRREVVASEAFGSYTSLITAVQDTAASRLADGMVLVGLPYEYINHLNHAAELLAQMRGLTNGVLRARAMSEAAGDELARALVVYEEVLRLYERALPGAVRSVHAEALYHPAVLAAVERVRYLAQARKPSDFGLDAAGWWTLSTQAVDALSSVARDQSAELARLAERRIVAIERQLQYTVAALMLLGVLTLVMVISTVGRIMRGLDRLLVGLDNVGRHRKFDERIADSGHDEFGTISDGINKLIAIAGSVVQEQETLSLTDALTGATNRRGFDQQLAARTTKARVHSLPLALVMIDIDHFKSVNDTLGHPAGDQVLRQMGQLLRAELRADDVLARFGGEEFAALLPGCAMGAALDVAQKLRMAIEAHDFGIGRRVTASLGVATWAHGRSGIEMLAEADAQLYAAKQGGRNCVMPGVARAFECALAA